MNKRLKLATLIGMVFSALAFSATAQKTATLIDFTYIPRDALGNDDNSRRPYEYAFGDWGNNKVQLIRDKGLVINHLGSKGGVGMNKGLRLKGADKAVVVFIIGNRNEAESFNFNLTDKDGTDHSFRIPLTGMSKGQVLTAVIRLDKAKKENKPGTKPGLDLEKLKSWQIAGDFGDKPLEVLVQKVLSYKDEEP